MAFFPRYSRRGGLFRPPRPPRLRAGKMPIFERLARSGAGLLFCGQCLSDSGKTNCRSDVGGVTMMCPDIATRIASVGAAIDAET